MTLENTIGYTIRSIREDKNLMAKTVAARVPMSGSYLCEIERCEKTPSVAMLADIAGALGIELTDLWYEIYKNLGGVK